MIEPEDLVLQHEIPYNPTERHEYYLRTRHLKGRRSGKHYTPGDSTGSSNTVASLRPVIGDRKDDAAVQRRKELHARVVKLTNRLEHLKKALRDLVEAAKGRSGVKPSDNPSTRSAPAKESSGAKDAPTKKLTGTQKRAAAKRSADYYDKHAKKVKPSEAAREERLKAEIQQVEQKIMRARRFLTDAVEKARNDVISTKPAANKSRNL